MYVHSYVLDVQGSSTPQFLGQNEWRTAVGAQKGLDETSVVAGHAAIHVCGYPFPEAYHSDMFFSAFRS